MSWCWWNPAWQKRKVLNVEAKCITFVIKFGGYVVALISDENQIEIKSNWGRFCGFRNCEFFGVNMRNDLQKSLIIERDKVINVTRW